MLVKFARDFFFEEMLYKARSWGTEFPSAIGGKPVVEFDDPTDKAKAFHLPKGAKILDGPLAKKPPKVGANTLSALANAPAGMSFNAAMKQLADDED